MAKSKGFYIGRGVMVVGLAVAGAALEANFGAFSTPARFVGSRIPAYKFCDSREEIEARYKTSLHKDCGGSTEEEDLPLSRNYGYRVLKIDASAAAATPTLSYNHAFRVTCEEDVNLDVLNKERGAATPKQPKARKQQRQFVFEGDVGERDYKAFVDAVKAGDILIIDFENGRRLRRGYWSVPLPRGEAPIYGRPGAAIGQEIVFFDRDGLNYVSRLQVNTLPGAGSDKPKQTLTPVEPKPTGR